MTRDKATMQTDIAILQRLIDRHGYGLRTLHAVRADDATLDLWTAELHVLMRARDLTIVEEAAMPERMPDSPAGDNGQAAPLLDLSVEALRIQRAMFNALPPNPEA